MRIYDYKGLKVIKTMDDTEKSTINNYEKPEETAEEVSYSFEGRENFTLQRQHELKSVVPKSSTYGLIETPYQDELSAVDLRMTRPPRMNNSSGVNIEYYKNKKDAVSMAHLLKNVNSNDSYLVNDSPNLQVQNPTENGNNSISNLESYRGDVNQVLHNHCTSYQKIDPQKKYTLKKVCFNGPDLWNAEKDVDFVLLVDQETQTRLKEFKETSVQTDTIDKRTYTLLKKRKNLSSLNYSCLICQRFYSSKSSYDRHARTHVTNENVITNFITTESKFKIFEENIFKSSQSHVGLPMTLQEPKFIKFQCSICCKSFASQAARDIHMDSLVLEEFPMVKCKECHVKFFTLGALQEHVYFVHDRNAYKCNAYCCVFCNESFESSYSFQLHLDEHLQK